MRRAVKFATRLAAGLILAATVASCGPPRFKTYDGPAVTQVLVVKSQRRIYAMHDTTVLADYPISLGFAPDGPKQFYGDGKTPEGRYTIDRRLVGGGYFLGLGISYPNARDTAAAEAAGRDPGGDIFIHGQAGWFTRKGDWTAGCIAVSDRAISDLYAMVPDGTPIVIEP